MKKKEKPQEKNLTSDDIWVIFFDLTKKKQIETLLEALDYMQQYNGRSKIICIAAAMNYECRNGKTYDYKFANDTP